MKHRILLCVLSLSLLTLGCNNPNIKFSGKVTFPDGQPLTTGLVCFSTSAFMASGELQADGTYSLGSLSENDGIPPGKYKVYVQGAVEEINGKTTPLIDPKFTASGSTPLEYEVAKGVSPRFDFVVEYPPKR
jgi:hypothetical protein